MSPPAGGVRAGAGRYVPGDFPPVRELVAVTPGFRDYVLEQLGRHAPGVRARAMFGGVSVQTSEGTFALIDEDIVYLKGDATNRDRFIAAGWPPFRPFGAEGSAMGYFAVPGELLEDPDELGPWVLLAREAALRAPARKRKKT